jgi:hypothetical protein
MKALKVLVIAIVAICTFGSARAQVVVKARIGDDHQHRRVVVQHRQYHRRVVVVHHHYRHDRDNRRY